MIPMALMAGASLIGGIAGGKSSKKLAKQQLALQREMFDFQKKRYDDYKSLYGDLEGQMVADAKKGVVADLAGVTNRASADVATQFGNAEDARLRNMQRMGINPNSGRADALAARNSIAQSLAAAGNITTGREAERRNAEQQTWDRRAAVTNQGISQMNGASSAMMGAQGAMAGTYGQMAANKASQAGALFGAAGSLVGMGAFDGVGGKIKSFFGGSAPAGATQAGLNLNVSGNEFSDRMSGNILPAGGYGIPGLY